MKLDCPRERPPRGQPASAHYYTTFRSACRVWDPEVDEYRRGDPLAQTGQVEMAEALLARGATLTAPIAVRLGKSEWLREKHATGKLKPRH